MDCPFHQNDGGHSVHGGLSFPIEATQCASCIAGICQCGLACYMPQQEEPKPTTLRQHLYRLFLATPEARGRAVGAALGLGGVGMFAWEAGKFFFN